MKRNLSPLRYPGGKTRAIPILDSFVNRYFPSKRVLLSPFFGGGSFELFLAAKGYTVYGNDLFRPLVTFWETKQRTPQALVHRIRENMPVTKEKFYELRKTLVNHNPGTHQLDLAAAYFLLNRTSFNGTTLCGGYSTSASTNRLTESSISRLLTCDVSAIEFSNLDCNLFLERHPETTETLIYADPPYYLESRLYGKDGDMHATFNHTMFADLLQKRRDWILSYNDCQFVREIWGTCRIVEVKWSYGMNSTKASAELLILPPLP